MNVRSNSNISFKEQQSTFFMVKPDGVKKGIEIPVLETFTKNGLSLSKIERDTLSQEVAEKHYQEHKGKSFFEKLTNYVTSGPVLKVKVDGDEAITKVRTLAGQFREQWGTDKTVNAVHSSDSKESAKRELALHFPEEAPPQQKKVDIVA